MAALPFTKLEMPQMPSDVIVGFKTLILPVLQNNTLCRGSWMWRNFCSGWLGSIGYCVSEGRKPSQQVKTLWFSEKRVIQSIIVVVCGLVLWRLFLYNAIVYMVQHQPFGQVAMFKPMEPGSPLELFRLRIAVTKASEDDMWTPWPLIVMWYHVKTSFKRENGLHRTSSSYHSSCCMSVMSCVMYVWCMSVCSSTKVVQIALLLQ